MVNILEVGKMAFESYKKDVVASVIFGLISLLIEMVPILIVPIILGFMIGIIGVMIGIIIGSIIEAYLFPRILEWYYNKTIGNIKSDHKLTFKIWLIRLLVMNIFFLSIFSIGIMSLTKIGFPFTEILITTLNLSNFIIIFLISLILWIIVELIFYYQAYASILGKINKIEINSTIVEKSLILIFYVLVWSIILGIIGAIIMAIPVVGVILYLICGRFVFVPILNLIIAHKALSM